MNQDGNAIRVFVSHASADKEYVDQFVNSVLMRGASLTPEEVFYTSAADTGVRSGEDLNRVLREEAGASSLIIALVTPTYQTRPFCVAELGAAWARDVLFPLMAPTMQRSDLEGVLPGLLIRSADDYSALNDLGDRVRELGKDYSQRSWGVGLEHWLSFLEGKPNVVPESSQPTVDEMRELEAQLDASRVAYKESQEENAKLLDRIERVKQAKTPSEVLEADLPSDEYERFEELKSAASSAVKELPMSVAQALWHDLADQSMLLPDPREDFFVGNDSCSEQVKVGRLVFDEETGEVSPDEDYPDVGSASREILALADFLDEADRSREFVTYFKDNFGVPMNLKKKGCWDALI